jgi:hypothetical protein
MSPTTGNSNSNDCDSNDHRQCDDTMADETDGNHDRNSNNFTANDDNDDNKKIPPPAKDAISSSTTSDDDDSDPVMISPNITPEKSSLVLVTTDSNGQRAQVRLDDSIQLGKLEKADLKQATKSTTTATTRIPIPSFVVAGFNRKSSLWQIQNWIALSLTLDGRDKITKTLQYVSRLLAWWFLVMSTTKNTSTATTATTMMMKTFHQHQSMRFTNLCKALSNSRKAFRLGRSITEAHKIASMGLIGLWCWHLKRYIDSLDGTEPDQDGKAASSSSKPPPPRTIIRRASSNIGWGPMTLPSPETMTGSNARSLVRSLSSMAYRKMYRPMISQVSSTLATVSTTTSATPTVELWMATGSAMKMLGLLGFWLGDNITFVTSNGGLDNYYLSPEERLARRKKWQTLASNKANQAYFVGAMAGLVTNAYAYYRFRQDKLVQAKQQYQESIQQLRQQQEEDDDALDNDDMTKEEEEEEQQHAWKQLQKVQEKQFSLFLALLKSCVDVTAFSNNPGVDLHQKWRGQKNNEGLHCLCGLISAGVVLYNNFPDAKKKSN